MDLTGKHILDVTCGGRSIWFNKEHPAAVYCDKREGDFGMWVCKGKKTQIHVYPDVVCDFSDLPFPDESFEMVVFDPPHMERLTETAWLRAKYGNLEPNWREVLRGGQRNVCECLNLTGC